MGTLASITLYSVLVLIGMTVAAGAFSFLGIWLSDQSEENEGH
ncbi:MAG: hypothetical protein U5J97_09910 [Trueperaceae bacterium]|nr:hypothetical protein [Trueperaceae bacterium]